jgi:hypothetical protein
MGSRITHGFGHMFVVPETRRLLAPLILLTLGLTACGGGDGGGGGRASPSPAAARLEKYCASVLTIKSLTLPDIDFDALSPEQQAEEGKKFARESIRPIADDMVANAPREVSDEIGVFDNAVKEVENTGSFDPLERPDVLEASKSAHEFDVARCGWKRVDVTAVNYAFSGVPPELKRGPTSFELTNNGTEHHEMVIYRRNDDIKETFDQLLAMPQEEAEQRVTFVVQDDAQPQEDGAHAVADLKGGEYAMICFIPVGSTPEAERAAQEARQEIQGPPHFIRGMKSEFTVK